MIHKGKAEIITAFKQFPDTTHSLDSIVVDVLPLACNAVEVPARLNGIVLALVNVSVHLAVCSVSWSLLFSAKS